TRRSCFKCEAKRWVHSLSFGCTAGPRPSARQGICEQLADARQELRAHSRVEAVRIARADRQEAQGPLGAERRECDGADLDGVFAEQEVALRIPDLPAAGLSR